jgi:hypothetical protein
MLLIEVGERIFRIAISVNLSASGTERILEGMSEAPLCDHHFKSMDWNEVLWRLPDGVEQVQYWRIARSQIANAITAQRSATSLWPGAKSVSTLP